MSSIINHQRGIVAVNSALRPMAGSPAEFMAQIGDGIEKFKASHTADLDKLTRIIEAQASGMDEINAQLAALKVGGVGSGDDYESGIGAGNAKAARAAVTEFMRNGNVGAMNALLPKAAMSSDSSPDGGYTVPKEIDRDIQSVLTKLSPMRALALIARTSTSDYHKLVNRRGASSGWVGERESRDATDSPVLADIAPPIGEVYAMPEITARLLDDSAFDLSAWIAENVTDEFAEQEGEAFVSGNGINKPRGILTYDAVSTGDDTRDFGKLQYVPTGVAAAISDSTHNGIDALINLVHSVRSSYRQGPGVGWQMNSTTASLIRKLKSKTDEQYLWQPSSIEGMPDKLLGYPVYENEFFGDIGANAYPIAFGNWRRGYVIVDRSELRLLRDPFTKKGWIRFYFTKRVGGAATDTNAIKLLKCATL